MTKDHATVERIVEQMRAYATSPTSSTWDPRPLTVSAHKVIEWADSLAALAQGAAHEPDEQLDAAFDSAMRRSITVASGGAQGWQPIATAPLGDSVIVYDEGWIGVASHDDDAAGDWYDACGKKIDPPPTHWMPLPVPPTGETR